MLQSEETIQQFWTLLHSGETLPPTKPGKIKFHQHGHPRVVKHYLHWFFCVVVQEIFTFTNCCLPPRELCFYSLWRRKVNLRNFVSFVSVREIFKNCSWVWSYTSKCSLRAQGFAFSRWHVEKSLFVVFLWLVVNLSFLV